MELRFLKCVFDLLNLSRRIHVVSLVDVQTSSSCDGAIFVLDYAACDGPMRHTRPLT